jgi:hypothetical protein
MDINQTGMDRLQSFTTSLSVKMTCGFYLMVNNSIDKFFFSPYTSDVRRAKAVPSAAQISAKVTPRIIQDVSSIVVFHKN